MKQTTKTTPVAFNPNEMYASALDLDPALQKELKEKGLKARWINAIEYKKNYGFNKSRWSPYKRESVVTASGLYDKDAEGYTRRGDLILATKTVEEHKRQRQMLNQKASLYKGHNAAKAEELRNFTKQAGIKAKIIEGYDENGDSDESDD